MNKVHTFCFSNMYTNSQKGPYLENSALQLGMTGLLRLKFGKCDYFRKGLEKNIVFLNLVKLLYLYIF